MIREEDMLLLLLCSTSPKHKGFCCVLCTAVGVTFFMSLSFWEKKSLKRNIYIYSGMLDAFFAIKFGRMHACMMINLKLKSFSAGSYQTSPNSQSYIFFIMGVPNV